MDPEGNQTPRRVHRAGEVAREKRTRVRKERTKEGLARLSDDQTTGLARPDPQEDAPLAVADAGPLARLEEFKSNENFPEEVFARVAEGETLRKIARSLGLPPAPFSRWYMETHGDLYEKGRIARAEDLVDAALGAATSDLGKDEVPAAKLKAEILMKVASKYDRNRYGESIQVNKNETFVVDAGLVGLASDLIRKIGSKPGLARRAIGHQTLTIDHDEDEGETL